jgi:hypothetical protein
LPLAVRQRIKVCIRWSCIRKRSKNALLMKSYLIGYELNTPGEECWDLIAAIEKLSDTHRRCLHSSWIIKLRVDPASELRTHLQKVKARFDRDIAARSKGSTFKSQPACMATAMAIPFYAVFGPAR